MDGLTRPTLTTPTRNISFRPNRSTTTFMLSIRAFDHLQWPLKLNRDSSVSSTMKVLMPFTSACLRRSLTGVRASRGLDFAAAAFHRLGEGQHAFGGIRPAIEDHVSQCSRRAGSSSS